MPTYLRPRWLVIVFLLLLPLRLGAQAKVDSIHHRNNCRLAIQIVTTGHPQARFDWAAGYVDLCGVEGAQALAHVLLDRRNLQPHELEFVVFAASRIVDRDLFEVALEVAADESRTTGFRVQAIRVLHQQINPSTVFDFATYVSDDDRAFGFMTHSEPEILRPLLLGSTETAIKVLTRIRDTPSVDPALHNAAERARANFEGKLSYRRRCAENPLDLLCRHR